ncbi:MULTISPECIES: ABC transporter permease [unclassified Pseudomonas]|uniref:ABC transporter permease n=1 Tax=unclassified Pseudomonas TaxID=196821 RepID=UPI000EA8CCB0|nr:MULTISPECIES: ABC transporter permease [unclassified Pseudomonas]AYF87760.1 ABC transporter permease [Pseudomonas sp. DY-1]MDH4655539.1 ABC transporter permease [Pseudomonas sp. BN606]MRK19959.1 ABC transporter permease [Pseudomonas sp. JG-B]
MEHIDLTEPVGAAPLRPAKAVSPTVRAWLFLTPSMLFLAVLVAASLLVLRMSIGDKGAEWSGFSLASYAQLAEPYYLKSLLLTLRLALFSALIAVALAIPVGYCMSRLQSPFLRRVFLAAVLLPLLVNLLLQSYGWLVILGPAGMLNQALMGLGLIDRPVMLLYNQTGVLMGLVQTAFPLAVLPIASAMRGVSRTYEEAAATLGASRVRVFCQVVLPMSLPGIFTGATLVFAYNASSFVVPLLLGGRRVPMLAVMVHDQIAPLMNWPAASAAGVVLIVTTLAIMTFSEYVTGRRRRMLEASQ